jgi:hypothetical protein
MSAEKIDDLARQIQIAKKNVEDWPEWMKNAAYFSGTQLDQSTVQKAVEEPGSGAGPSTIRPKE